MPPRFSVTDQRRTATKRIVLCCGFVGLSFLAIVGFGLLQRSQASENILPHRQVSAAPTETHPKLVATYGKLPLGFEANQGQVGGPVKFLSHGRGSTIFLTADEAVLTLRKSQPRMSRFGKFGLPGRLDPFGPLDQRGGRWPSHAGDWKSLWRSLIPDVGQLLPDPSAGKAGVAWGLESEPLQVVRMRLVGGNAKARVVGLDELPGRSNYFIGNDPKKWRTNVPTYAKVRFHDVCSGVDLVYYGNQGGQLEYDFFVAPGADPNQIKLSFAGAEGMRVDAASGDLVLKVGKEEVRFQKPALYQPAVAAVYDRRFQPSTNRDPVTAVSGPDARHSSLATRHCSFVLASNNEVAFRVAGYDPKRALVIDPVLSYSTYLGGSGWDQGSSIAVDAAGNAYVTGYTESADFPTANPLQATLRGTCGTAPNTYACPDVFVTKLNPSGSALVYSTYLGGSGWDQGSGIAVDAAGNAYVTGTTYSADFPTANPLQATNKAAAAHPGHDTAFVAKLSSTGSALVYSTYLGGSNEDAASGIAVDSSGNAYVTGGTSSTNFPTVNPFQATCGGSWQNCGDAFVAKLNPAGSALVYSTYLGGSGGDGASGIAVDAAGNAYVTGTTDSTNFPTANPLQANCDGCANNNRRDAFVAKLNPAGSALVYSTYLGGSSYDDGTGIAVDAAGNAYVAGRTYSTDFPTANPLQSTCGGCGSPNYHDDAFVAKLNPTGTALVYSTYLGGSNEEAATGIAVDSSGNAYVTGFTNSTDFPTANPLQPGYGVDAFVAELNPTGSVLVYSTYLGGSNENAATGIAADSSGNAYVTGYTESTDFPTADPLQAGYGGGMDAFVAMIGPPMLSPTSLSFPNEMVGTASPAEPVTVSNFGYANLTISSIAIAGSVTGDFAVAATGTTCSTSAALAPGASCVINVTFTPTIVGSESASLSVSDSAASSPQTVPLSGTGVLLPAPNVSPTSLSFNNQLVGTTSTPQPVTVTNTGTLALSITRVGISSGWTQSNNCLPSIPADASCTINVSFQPIAGGFQTGTLTLTDLALDSPQTVSLSGTGVVPVVSLSATSLSFPAQTVSTPSAPQALTLTNTGTAALTPLTITTSGDFAQTNNCAGSVAAGAGCTISVTFTPTAPGNRTGTLTLTDNALNSPQRVSLSGTGVVPVVSLSATSLSFPGQTVSTPSPPQTLTLTNTGAGVLTPLTITTIGDFAQTNTCAGSVAASGSCTISVTFTPTASGNRTGTLTLTDNASNSPQKVSLSGTGLAPVVSLSTTSLSFAGQTVSTPSPPQTLLLTNTGAGALTPLTITTSGDFAQTNTCAGSVAAGAGCEISVTFTPTAPGNRTGALTLTDNALNSPQTVTLSGTGLGATASLSVSSLTFARQLVATTSSSQPVTLSNTGNVALTVTSIAISPNFGQTNNCASSLAASGSCTISVTFSPTATGPLTGTLTITDNSNRVAGSTQTVSLSGTGTAVTVSATSLSFGAQLVGSGSLKTVTLTNLGSTPLSISGLTVVSFAPLTPLGTKAGDFAIQSSSCVAGGSVPGPGSCTIKLAFKPTAAGVRSATLVIADSDPTSPQTVNLRGTGTAVRLSATSLNFGPQPVGTTSAPKTVTLTNLGNTPLRIESLTLGGTDAGDFAIQASSTCAVGSTVASEGSCTINLTFKPTAAGARSATLVIGDSDPSSPQTASLSGTGM
ncbi:MAG: choice-of-anchor D domain-containing protein [Terriglobia bacterium]|jgi:hypothetical protein